MKIRIQGNSIRLRLTQTEISDFGEKGLVEENITFAGSSKLTYALKKADCEEIQCSFIQNRIEVCVPEKLATVWTNTEMVSLDNQVSPNDRSALKILVEKDFACLKERVGEDESDMFPHPDEETHKC